MSAAFFNEKYICPFSVDDTNLPAPFILAVMFVFAIHNAIYIVGVSTCLTKIIKSIK